jgi:hypothetical protein
MQESSLKKPIKFFQYFFGMNQVSQFRAFIMSKPENAIFCTGISGSNNKKSSRKQSLWLTDACFERILDIHLTYEYLLSKDLIDDNIENRVEISKQRNLVARILEECLFLIKKVRSNEQLRQLQCCERTLVRIIRFLFVEHKCLCPKSTAEIELLLDTTYDPLGNISLSTLNTGIARAILDLKDSEGENLFFENPDKDRLKKDLVLLVSGQLDMMMPINIQKNRSAFHYLIALLRERGNGPSAKKLENSKKILFQGEPFLADHHGKIIYKYKRKSNPLKGIIETLIDQYSS